MWKRYRMVIKLPIGNQKNIKLMIDLYFTKNWVWFMKFMRFLQQKYPKVIRNIVKAVNLMILLMINRFYKLTKSIRIKMFLKIKQYDWMH